MPPTQTAPKAEAMPITSSSMSQPNPQHLSGMGPILSAVKTPLPATSAEESSTSAAMPLPLKSLAVHDQPDQLPDPMAVHPASSSVRMGQPERKSIDVLYFSTAAMSVSALASEESAHRLESDCRSSTSDNSSVQAFEVWCCACC